MLIVFTTTPNAAVAAILAEQIVTTGLAACVQILPQITSVYKWEGEVQSETECLMLIKTIDEKYDELSAFITTNHSYAVPEVVAVKTDLVSEAYSEWMRETLS